MVITKEEDASGEHSEDIVRKRCKHCDDFTYEDSQSGRARLMLHIKKVHPDQTKRGKEQTDKAQKAANEPPLATRFREIAERVLAQNVTVKDTMVSIFARYSTQLGADRTKFRAWIARYGLTQDQISQIEDELFGLDKDLVGGGGAGGFTPFGSGGQVGYVPGPNGQMTPVIIVSPQAAPSQPNMLGPNGQPMVIFPPASAADPAVKELSSKLDALIEKIAKSQEPSGTPMQRLPMRGPDGQMVKDESGQTVYYETPYDPTMAQMQMWMGMFHIIRGEGGKFDEEKLLLKMKEQITGGQAQVPDALTRMVEEAKKAAETASQEVQKLRHQNEVQEAVEGAVRPLQDQISELRGKTGLSDTQFGMQHQQELLKIWGNFMQSAVSSVREDLKPMMINATIATMRQSGVPDETINTVVSNLSASGGSSLPSAIKSKIAEATSKWVKP